MKTTKFCILLIILFNLSFYCLAETEKIKIGLVAPLTGAGAAYGVDIKNAVVFANENLADSGYELIIEDEQCSNKEAVAVAHKLVNQDKVKYVIGPGCSGSVLASAPVYEKAKVITITPGAGAPAITNAGDYIFRTKPSLNFAADLLRNDMTKRFKKVGVITEETDYCRGLSDSLIINSHSDLRFFQETFIPGNEDFRAIFFKI